MHASESRIAEEPLEARLPEDSESAGDFQREIDDLPARFHRAMFRYHDFRGPHSAVIFS